MSGTDPLRWRSIIDHCTKCQAEIASQYEKDQLNNLKRYKKYHRDLNPTLEEITTHAPKNQYYNATMYDGAKFWSNIAPARLFQSLPKVPTGIPK
jgi:hypothetical protein